MPPTTGELVRADQEHLIHPLHHPVDNENTVVYVRGRGVTVVDSDGHEYIDGLSGLWNVNVGHGRHELADAAAAQMKELAYCSGFVGSTNLRSIELANRLLEIAGQAMVTDMPSTFEERSSIKIVGFDMSKKAADIAYEQAEVGADDVDVVELHDCFSANELITYEALGLAAEGEGHKLVENEDTTYGGRWVVNPSGGLISKGHPLGATGLAQCSELTWQLRGDADKRQVEGAKVGLQHNIGLGGAAVVSIYKPAA